MFIPPPSFWSERITKNKKIKDFSIEGVIADDSFMVGHRARMEKILENQMRDSGYVPHLDLDAQYFISYNEENDTFSFHCIAFGVYVGKKKSYEMLGLSGSQFVLKG